MTVPGPLDVANTAGIDAFRAVLVTAGRERYADVDPTAGTTPENSALWPSSRTLALRCVHEAGALGTLVKLFVLGLAVDRDAASAALSPMSLEAVTDLGLTEIHDGAVVATMRLAGSNGLLLACDQSSGLRPRADHVMGITLSSALLANLTVRRNVPSTLDVGTGCGLHALIASRYSERVVATDLNPRAVNFTEFSCRLNEIDNVECRTGSFLEPVVGETFDQILCNPPFVISPDNDILFRDSGRPGDDVSRELVRTIPAHLNEGGLAQILVSWVCRENEHWSEPLRRWIPGLGCDVFLFCIRKEPAARYAEVWNDDLQADPEQQARAFNRWLDYLQSEGIHSVGSGAVILRRRNGPNWVRTENIMRYQTQTGGPQIGRFIAAEDRLAPLSDDDLLLQTLRPSQNHLEQVLIGTRSGYARTETTLALDGGLPIRRKIDSLGLSLLLHLDGTRRLADAIEEAGADRDGALGMVRDLIGLGALEFADDRGQSPDS